MTHSRSSPQVSFIIPLYNGLEFTQAMLASLRATLPAALPHEIIFVDNGSSDGTRDWLQTLGGAPFRIILNDRNLGYAAANNRGVREARGEFLALLNNDLVLLPGWFEPMMELVSQPEKGIVGNVQLWVKGGWIEHAGVYFDHSGRPIHFRPSKEHLFALDVIEPPAVTGACMMMRRALFQKLGGLDEAYRNGYEDMDLCMKALSAGHRIAVATRSAAYHYIGASAGRYDQEDANAARFQALWGKLALELSRIQPPIVEAKAPSSGKPRRAPFDINAFATFQAFHPGPKGHTEENSWVHLYPTGTWTHLRVPLPFGLTNHGAATVRLDPCHSPATISIKAFDLREAGSRRVVWSADATKLNEVLTATGTAAQKQEGNPWLTVESTGNDPHLLIRPKPIPATLLDRTDLTIDLLIHVSITP